MTYSENPFNKVKNNNNEPTKTKAELWEYLKKEYSNYDKSVKHEDDRICFSEFLDETYLSGEKEYKPIFGWLVKKDSRRDLVLIEL